MVLSVPCLPLSCSANAIVRLLNSTSTKSLSFAPPMASWLVLQYPRRCKLVIPLSWPTPAMLPPIPGEKNCFAASRPQAVPPKLQKPTTRLCKRSCLHHSCRTTTLGQAGPHLMMVLSVPSLPLTNFFSSKPTWAELVAACV